MTEELVSIVGPILESIDLIAYARDTHTLAIDFGQFNDKTIYISLNDGVIEIEGSSVLLLSTCSETVNLSDPESLEQLKYRIYSVHTQLLNCQHYWQNALQGVYRSQIDDDGVFSLNGDQIGKLVTAKYDINHLRVTRFDTYITSTLEILDHSFSYHLNEWLQEVCNDHEKRLRAMQEYEASDQG